VDIKRLYPILLIIFTNILGAGVIIPILPLYAEGEFAGSVLQITLLASAFFGTQFLAAPWLGRLSDRYGRRPVLILSQVGTVLAFILFIFAGELGELVEFLAAPLGMSGGMLMLFAARLLDGITGGNITTAQAYVSDITADSDRARGLGLLQAAFGAGFIFGPAFGGILSTYGARMPFIGATFITTLTLLLTIFTLTESLPVDERSNSPQRAGKGRGLSRSQIFAQPALVLILVMVFLSSLAFSVLPAIFALYSGQVLFAQAANPDRVRFYIGLMLAFNGMMQVLTQLAFLRPLVARLGERRLLLIGYAAISLGLFGLAAAASAWVATLFMAPNAFGFGVSEPSAQTLLTRFGVRSVRGYLLGLYQSARSLALIIGPIWAGLIYQAISPRAVFAISGGIMLTAVLGAAMLNRMSISRFEAI
jgi:DHA1 family tetracycline resistance protein-like MFS transporter